MAKRASKKEPGKAAMRTAAALQDDIFEQSPYSIAFQIHDVSRLRKTLIDQILKPHGVTRSQWWVLANLARNRGRSFSQVELGRILDMQKVSIGTLIQRMEKNGLLHRIPSPEDGRAKHVMITDKGLTKLKKLTDIAAPTNALIGQGISDADLEIATRVLGQMKRNVKTILEKRKN